MDRIRCWLRIAKWWVSPPEGWQYDGLDRSAPPNPYPRCKP